MLLKGLAINQQAFDEASLFKENQYISYNFTVGIHILIGREACLGISGFH